MALVAEDGTGLPDATTFATRAEFIAYALARGVTVPDTDASDVHLVKAMDVLHTKPFVGDPVVAEQGAPFPRLYIATGGRDPVFASASVPGNIKKAQLALALASFQGVTLMAQTSAGPRVTSRDVGPMKRTYSADGGTEFAVVAGVDALLAPYLMKGGPQLVTRRA